MTAREKRLERELTKEREKNSGQGVWLTVITGAAVILIWLWTLSQA